MAAAMDMNQPSTTQVPQKPETAITSQASANDFSLLSVPKVKATNGFDVAVVSPTPNKTAPSSTSTTRPAVTNAPSKFTGLTVAQYQNIPGWDKMTTNEKVAALTNKYKMPAGTSLENMKRQPDDYWHPATNINGKTGWYTQYEIPIGDNRYFPAPGTNMTLVKDTYNRMMTWEPKSPVGSVNIGTGSKWTIINGKKIDMEKLRKQQGQSAQK